MAHVRIQMHIKYCEPCQMHQVNKLDKFPHELQPIKIPNKIWSQIGKSIYTTKYYDQ